MIRMFFGSPGCGKTTTATRNIYKLQQAKKRYDKRTTGKLRFFWRTYYWLVPPTFYDGYYTNFDTELSTSVNLFELGQWTLPPHTHLTVDESGIEYNNRKYKALSQDTIKWLKLHRHYRVDVDFYSQSWEDTDVTIRRLADQYWHVRRLGPFTLCREIRKFVTVNDHDKQIVDGYEFKSFWLRLLPWPWHRKTWYIFLRLPYFKYFDSYVTPPTPVRYKNNSASAD